MFIQPLVPNGNRESLFSIFDKTIVIKITNFQQNMEIDNEMINYFGGLL